MVYKIKNRILKRLTLGCLVLLVICSQNADAQFTSDSLGFHLMDSVLGARSSSLANTQVSDSYSLEGIYSNPASFLFSETNTKVLVNSFYSPYYNVVAQNITGVIKRNDRHYFALGGSLKHTGPEIDPFPKPTRFLNFTQIGLSLNYATMISSTFSMGLGLNSVYGITDDVSDWAIRSRIGLFYAPSPSVSYGVSYSGFGSSRYTNLGGGLLYSYQENETGEGNGTTLLIERAPHRLEIGTTFRFPTLSNQPNFKLSFANEKIFGEPGLIYKGGLEIYPFDLIALRGGYFYSPYAQGGRAGIGLLLSGVTIDYAFANSLIGINGNAHLISISLNFSTQN